MPSPGALTGFAYAQGYALRTAGGVLLPLSFRATREASIASVFTSPEHGADAWAFAQADGWSVEFVYSQVWTPVFHVSKPAEEVTA